MRASSRKKKPAKKPSEKQSGTSTPSPRGSRKRKSIVKPRHKRWIAAKCVIVVTLLQGAMLLTWWVAPTWDPPRVHLLQLMWAWMHQPTFYPFVALLIGGPVLTVIAVRIQGWHRLWLALSWAVFAWMTWFFFQHRLLVMVDVLRWKYDL